jgi:hypothetical protein
MTIRINDLYAQEALELLSSLPEDAISVDPKPWYADEVKRRIEEYKRGEMETTLLREGMEDIEAYLREINTLAS